MRFATLPDWLGWLEQQHPKSIDLGLDRILEVAHRLGISGFNATVMTVAGTNGKGSFVAAMDALLRSHGKRVATYTSPHLLVFNERIKLDGAMVSDEQLLLALDQVDKACQGVSLTYFEFTTLAALVLFGQQAFDVIVLEVGLGGRLDAVNIIKPDIAVITSIGLDHQEYLGNNLEMIAAEKCGILRNDTVLFCAESNPPKPLSQAIASHHSWLIGRDFSVTETAGEWSVTAPVWFHEPLVFPVNGLSVPSQAAAIGCLFHLLGEKVDQKHIHSALDGLSLAGRFQRFEVDGVSIILDVAHNVQAVSLLKTRLQKLPLHEDGKRLAVFNMLSDKDFRSVIANMKDVVDGWFLGELDHPRALKVQVVADVLSESGEHKISCSRNIRQAFARAMSVCRPGDQLVVFGSFYVVSELLPRLSQYE